MERRRFFKLVAGSTLLPLFSSMRLWGAPSSFNGDFFIQVQVDAGWDTSSFCDPKENLSGEKKINYWADSSTTQEIGNLRYAPFGENAKFFTSHYKKILIVNSVNAYTNSHTVGRLYNFTGRTSKGYPSLSASYAAVNGKDFPLPVIYNGGEFFTSGLVVGTKLGNDTATFKDILIPEERNAKGAFFSSENTELINGFIQRRAAEFDKQNVAMPKQRASIAEYQKAIIPAESALGFESILDAIDHGNFDSTNKFNRQLLYALTSFKSGLSISADVVVGGFDTHDNHDERHEPKLAQLTTGLDYMWYLAEQLGIAERLVVLVASDFARTPYYNAKQGKDHWSVGSNLFMAYNPSWGNRMVGKTNEGQQAYAINPSTLQVDTQQGIVMEPKHMLHAGRKLLGIANDPLMTPFDLRTDGIEFDIFNPSLITV
ncbi:MAG: DUF1501 domain-containing protein [Pseudomonadota bacterium]